MPDHTHDKHAYHLDRAAQLREQAINAGLAQLADEAGQSTAFDPPDQPSQPVSPSPTLPAAPAAPLFLPLNDRLLVRRLADTSETTGAAARDGLTMTDSLKEKPTICEVVAVGLGRLLDSGRLVPSLLEPGDKILVGKYSGTEVKLEGAEFVTLREEEVQGVVGTVIADRIKRWLLHTQTAFVVDNAIQLDK